MSTPITNSDLFSNTYSDNDNHAFRNCGVWEEDTKFYGDDEPDNAYLIIGFDTEYVGPKEDLSQEDIESGLGVNTILSYQTHCMVIDPNQPNAQEWSAIWYPGPKDQRLTLEGVYSLATSQAISGGFVSKLPKTTFLVSHFNRADLAGLRDLQDLKSKLVEIHGSFATIHPIKIAISGAGQGDASISIHIRDTMCLAGGKHKSLARLGESLGIPKLKLSSNAAQERYLKCHMDEVLATDPVLFEEYAINDALIACRFAARTISFNAELFDVFTLPKTLASMSEKLLLSEWESAGIDILSVLGKEIVREKYYNKTSGKYGSRKVAVDVEGLHLIKTLATEAFHGGRNEQFHFGASAVDTWTDYDLSGAYPTAMATIRHPDWSNARQSNKVADFTLETLGVAWIEFSFPASVRYPTIAVRCEESLIFPRSGKAYCSSPDIAVALALGAKITIRQGFIVPFLNDTRVFGDFIRRCAKERSRQPAGSLENGSWKEIANSTYGKLAQGTRNKRVYSLRDGSTKPIPPSKITHIVLAAHATSFVRATLGEMMNALPASATVFSCTTDGFLTNAAPDDVIAAQQGAAMKLYAATRQWLTGDPTSVEIKHQCRQLLGWQTRGQATLQPGNGGKTVDSNWVLAKGGIHTSAVLDTKADQNDHIVDLFFGRKPDQKLRVSMLSSVRDIIEHDADVVTKVADKRLTMEYDWKRCPVAAHETAPNSHVAFSTKPWDTADQYMAVRAYWSAFNKTPTCLKTLADFKRFAIDVFVRSSVGDLGVTHLNRGEPDVVLFRQSLCAAFRFSAAGLDRDALGLSAKQFASALSKAGVPCTARDVENARDGFVPNRVPQTPTVKELQKKIRKALPRLELSKLACGNTHSTINFIEQ